jgi:hypothetical protein
VAVTIEGAPSAPGFTYIVYGDAATVTGCTSTCPTTLVIPDTLDGHSVTIIAALAFNDESLTTVTIPNSVTAIGAYAFLGNALTTVTIPDSVTTIGTYAFEGNDLTSVTIGNSVASIEYGVFESNALTTVTIPDSVTSIGDYAFNANRLTTVTIGDSVTSIGARAFYGNRLTTVTIGDSVTSIGDYAFTFNDLTTVTIPGSVTSIGVAAFGSNNLTTVSIPNSVTSIGDEVFAVNALTTVSIPNSVTSIGEYAFAENLLTTVTIPNSVTSIGEGAFAYNDLTSVTIGSSVTSIGNGAFTYNLLTSVTIPDFVISIGSYAFQSNALASVTIGKNVTTIGYAAFTYNQLTSVTFLGNAPTDGGSVFGENAGLNYLLRASVATGWGATWSEMQVNIYKLSLTGLFTARANASAAGATVTYTAAGTTVALDSTGQAGGGTITYSVSDVDCSISGSTLTVVQVGDGSCVVTATIAASDNYLEATDTVTITIISADVRATATVKPSMSGTVAVGKTLTAAPGIWTGYPTPTFTYKWYACTRAVTAARTTVPSTCKVISGATRSTFKITTAQRGKYVAVLVTGTSLGTAATTWLSTTSVDVRATAIYKPAIRGTTTVGKTLTAAKGTWTGYPTPTFTYQWYACTRAVTIARTTVPSTCVQISGATRSTFKLTTAQRGKYVAVLVTGTSLRTTATTWLSKTTAKVR